MEQSLNYPALYLSGQPILLLDAIENNLLGFNARMQTLGLPTAGTAKEAFDLLEQNGSQMTLSEFLLLFDFQYIDNGQNPVLTDAFYKQAGLATPRPGNLSTFSWSKVWGQGFEKYFDNAFSEEQEAVVVESKNGNGNKPQMSDKEKAEMAVKASKKLRGVNVVLFTLVLFLCGVAVFKFVRK